MRAAAHPGEEVRERERDRDAHESGQQADPDREQRALEEHGLEEALPVRELERRRVNSPGSRCRSSSRHDPKGIRKNTTTSHRERQDPEGAAEGCSRALTTTRHNSLRREPHRDLGALLDGNPSRGRAGHDHVLPVPQSTKHSKSSPGPGRTRPTVAWRPFGMPSATSCAASAGPRSTPRRWRPLRPPRRRDDRRRRPSRHRTPRPPQVGAAMNPATNGDPGRRYTS